MRKFLLKGLLFGSFPIFVLVIGILLPAYPGTTKSFFFAKIDKDTLLQNTISPRVIFIGGSNLSMSLNSRMVRDSLHLNPINMGLDYNIGLVSMFQDVLGYIQKGDNVVLSSEYEQFFGRMIYGGYPYPIIEFEVSPWNFKRLNFDQWVNFIKVVPGYAVRRLKVWKYFLGNSLIKDSLYTRSGFNEFGDHIAHWQEEGRNPISTKSYQGLFNSEAIQLIVDFQKQLIAKSAKLFIIYPPYQQSSFINNKNNIAKIHQELIIAGLNVLSVPERYITNDTLIFDTPYHLTKKGVDIRTRLLIEDMQKYQTKH